jgi:hypothetical protein
LANKVGGVVFLGSFGQFFDFELDWEIEIMQTSISFFSDKWILTPNTNCVSVSSKRCCKFIYRVQVVNVIITKSLLFLKYLPSYSISFNELQSDLPALLLWRSIMPFPTGYSSGSSWFVSYALAGRFQVCVYCRYLERDTEMDLSVRGLLREYGWNVLRPR